MDPDDLAELAGELQGKTVGGWGLVQLAAGTGFAAYVVWAAVLMPGFRRVPLRLQVPYVPSSAKQVENVMSLLKGRSGKMVDLGSGDGRIVLEAYKRGFSPAVGYELNPWLLRLSNYRAWRAGCYGKVFYQQQDLWKVNLSDCYNVSVFLAPSVLPQLATKLLAELPDEARVVSGRVPFPTWMPTTIVGEGLNRSWAYDIKTIRQTGRNKLERSPE
ncbi:adenine nucleotide translocase lysine N-methyltransferase isoform X3 [Emydura macquarii macquarii]|uniref:adenine nucleotide translocase lysine N-methyltransferase isoform X3 n=1 Tax=Emydura macquarii macquarii TaxID=1129001 RepID=UPI00352B820D